MKILIATGLFSPDIGGPATYSKMLAEELPKRGFEVDVLSFGSVRYLPKIIRHFVYFLKVLRKGWKVDVIFAQDPVSVGLPAVLAAVILRKKFTLKIVGDYAWEQSVQRFGVKELLDDFLLKTYGWRVEFLRNIQKFVANKANRIIVPSGYLAEVVKKWDILEKKIMVVYNAASDINESHGLDSKKGIYLLSIGRLVPWKGFEILIEAMSELSDEIKLVIIGDGPMSKELKTKVRSLNLEGKVNLVGRVSHEKIADCFNKAKIFVLNTGYEGLSHVILEAMRYGAPVITTKVGGNPELIENGYNGILVEYNNKEQIKEAILKLWNDTELREKFVENSFKKLENFTKEKILSQTIEALKI